MERSHENTFRGIQSGICCLGCHRNLATPSAYKVKFASMVIYDGDCGGYRIPVAADCLSRIDQWCRGRAGTALQQVADVMATRLY